MLRALAVLDAVELPSMGADASAPSKRLIVRAEEKTRNALDEFGSSFSRTDADAHE